MKIVFANKYFFLKGGAERYLFELKSLLESHSHSIVPFAMAHKKNLPTPWEQYFVSEVQTERITSSIEALRTAGRFLYSFEARRKFSELLEAAKPDLVHVHNIYHQISPSILPEAKRRGIPVVMTAHDYNLVAPNYGLFHDGASCELTKPKRYWRAVGHKCVRNSYTASALAAFEKQLHDWLRLYEPNIDRIIAPSEFVRRKYTEFGIAPEKMTVVPHFIAADKVVPSYGSGEHGLFVGRLSEEKGALIALSAAEHYPQAKIIFAGTGPQEEKLRAMAQMRSIRNVEFVGHKSGEELAALYAHARFIIVPSITHETFGLTILEAYAAGKPVIASRIGGLSEVVRDGETGLLVQPNDAAALAAAMRRLWDDPAAAQTMGRAGRHWAETDFTPGVHYQRIMKVYEEAKVAAKEKS